ncbi:MAG: Maf family protein [Anaerolineae bacterium]
MSVFQLVLASQSLRRRELIKLLGYPVSSVTAVVDEDSIFHENPAINVVQTAVLKANAIKSQVEAAHPDGRKPIIIAADTTVALDGRQLGKPADETEASAMLRSLRGRTHEVHTGVTIVNLASGEQVKGVHTAVVTMRLFSDEEIAAYVANGDPMDKAGAYAIQHPTFRPVSRLDGCFTGVMGLSVCHLIQSLAKIGVPIRAEKSAVHDAHQQYPCPIFTKIAPGLLE